ncbi:MAG TPA: hypothetical protein VIY72_15560 [Acidimicrobiales bacterium]
MAWTTAVLLIVVSMGACGSSPPTEEAEPESVTSSTISGDDADSTPPSDVCSLLPVEDAVELYRALVATWHAGPEVFAPPEASAETVTVEYPERVAGTDDYGWYCRFDVPADGPGRFGISMQRHQLGAPIPGGGTVSSECNPDDATTDTTTEAGRPLPGGAVMVEEPPEMEMTALSGLGDEAYVNNLRGWICASGYSVTVESGFTGNDIAGDPAAVEQALRVVAENWGV